MPGISGIGNISNALSSNPTSNIDKISQAAAQATASLVESNLNIQAPSPGASESLSISVLKSSGFDVIGANIDVFA